MEDRIIDLKKEGKTWEEIADELEITLDKARGIARNSPRYNEIKQPDPHDKTDLENKKKDDRKVYEDGSIVEEIERHFREPLEPKSQSDFMELHKYDPDEFVFVNGESTVWTVTNGEGETFYNVRSKLKVRPMGDNELSIDEFIELMRKEPEPMNIELMGVGTRNLVIGLADLHFGVTSYEYLKEQLVEVMDIVTNGYDTIVIEQLGDLFHSSQMKETITLRGTILPTVDMVKAWHDAKSFYFELIEHSAKYANKVQIEHAAGNHSGNLEYGFLDLIKERYELADINLEVNNHNRWRTVYRLGNVGIMLAHGDNVKLKDLPGKFANEYRVLWGDTESHEAHTGHRHESFKEIEQDGVVMRQFPTPKPTDDWEDMKGYNSRKMIELVEYDEDRSRMVYEI